MKKLLFLCCAGVLCASDLIGVDSLFKQQSGIRSITSLSLLSTGNPNTRYDMGTQQGDITHCTTCNIRYSPTFRQFLSKVFEILN